jgi:hypothetical protein
MIVTGRSDSAGQAPGGPIDQVTRLRLPLSVTVAISPTVPARNRGRSYQRVFPGAGGLGLLDGLGALS